VNLRKAVSAAALIFCVLLGSTGSTPAETGLRLTAGIGYDYLSQDFYLDSLARTGSDSLDIITSLKTTYLNDFKGRLALDFVPYDDYRLDLKGVFEGTEDSYRFRLFSNWKPSIRSLRFDWSSEIDWRDGPVDADEGDPGYFSGNGRLRLSLPISRNVSLWSRAKGDFVAFDSAGFEVYDYYRLGGEAGISHTFGGFSTLSVSTFVAGRRVSDAPDQDYSSIGLDGSLLAFYARGEIDLVTHYESRDYNRPGGLDDYSRLELDAHNRHTLGGVFYARQEFELEAIFFDTTDYFTSDYQRFKAVFLVGLSRAKWAAAAGPCLEILSEEQTDDFVIGEAYSEIGLKLQLDLILPGRLFGSLESTTGRRDLKDEGSIDAAQSDFTFERLNVLADWTVAGGLSVNFLASADWEWHDNPDENSRLALLSASINYAF